MTPEEEQFIDYWEKNRVLAKKGFIQFLKGLSRGLFIGIGIVLVVSLGWYQRANIQANAYLNPFFLVFIILIIAIFMAFLYRNYQWEMREQQYLELLAKKKREKPSQSQKISE
jgi:di/tricarboxylate transporter